MEGSKKYNQLLTDFPTMCQSPKGKQLLSCYLPLERPVSDSKMPDTWGLITCLLVLSGTGVIFSVVASMGMYFGFVLNTVLITHCNIFVISEQGLHRIKAFSASCPAPPASRMGVHRKLRGDTARKAEPDWPKGCSIPSDVLLRI